MNKPSLHFVFNARQGKYQFRVEQPNPEFPDQIRALSGWIDGGIDRVTTERIVLRLKNPLIQEAWKNPATWS